MDMEVKDRIGVEPDPWIISARGGKVFFLRPQDSDITIEAVAEHTGKQCRWTGATRWFYSVAQHMALVGELVRRKLLQLGRSPDTVEFWNQVLAGYFHDAGEAHTGDFPSPLKRLVGTRLAEVEQGLCMEIFRRYGVDWSYYNEIVKEADDLAFQIERAYLIPEHPDFPKKDPKELPLRITKECCWGPGVAGQRYLELVMHALNERMRAQLLRH